MKLHIGSLIRRRAKELRIGPTEMGKMINTSKQNVYGIFKRASLDTELLRKISVALKFDFFSYYARELGISPENDNVLMEELSRCRNEFAQAEQDLINLHKQVEFLEKINRLLEEKLTDS